MLIAKGKISSEMIAMRSTWRHSGFNVFCGNRIQPKEKEAMETLARYLISHPIGRDAYPKNPGHRGCLPKGNFCLEEDAANPKRQDVDAFQGKNGVPANAAYFYHLEIIAYNKYRTLGTAIAFSKRRKTKNDRLGGCGS